MTRLLRPAPQVGVALGPEGVPERLEGPLSGSLEPVKSWLVEQDWWERPVARRYWKVLLRKQVLLEVFHDLELDAWFLERVYD